MACGSREHHFRRVRQRFGGKLRFAISGSAALNREVAEFVNALGIEVYEGYGLTEASPVVCVNTPVIAASAPWVSRSQVSN